MPAVKCHLLNGEKKKSVIIIQCWQCGEFGFFAMLVVAIRRRTRKQKAKRDFYRGEILRRNVSEEKEALFLALVKKKKNLKHNLKRCEKEGSFLSAA